MQSAMVLQGFDPSLIPSTLQNSMYINETLRESKMPTRFQVGSDFKMPLKNSKVSSPARRPEVKENLPSSEMINIKIN